MLVIKASETENERLHLIKAMTNLSYIKIMLNENKDK